MRADSSPAVCALLHCGACPRDCPLTPQRGRDPNSPPPPPVSPAGFLLESYGFWRLFSAFFPTVLSFLRRMPGLRKVLDLPVLKNVSAAAALAPAAAPPEAALSMGRRQAHPGRQSGRRQGRRRRPRPPPPASSARS